MRLPVGFTIVGAERLDLLVGEDENFQIVEAKKSWRENKKTDVEKCKT